MIFNAVLVTINNNNMKILDSHPSFFALMQGHRKIEVNADEPLSEYWWMRLLMYNIFNHTPEIKVEGIDFNFLPEMLFVTQNNDLRDWNKTEFFFSNDRSPFLVKIIDSEYSEDGLSCNFIVSIYTVKLARNPDGKLKFPFPHTMLPTKFMYVNLPIPELTEEYFAYMCD